MGRIYSSFLVVMMAEPIRDLTFIPDYGRERIHMPVDEISLISAVERNDAGLVGQILQHGADPNVELCHGAETLLMRAVIKGNLDIVALLLKSGARCMRRALSPILRAHSQTKNLLFLAFKHNLAMVDELLTAEDSLELLMEYLSLPEMHRYTAKSHELQMLSNVLQRGRDPNIHFRDFDNTVKTPLTFAIIKQNGQMVELLCQNGADVNKSMYSGRVYTPLMTIIYRTSDTARRMLAQYILSKGARTNIQTDKGNTALHMAVHKRCSFDIIMMLLKHGANVCLKDHKGRTPYHTALRRVYYPAFRLLLEAGVSNTITLSDQSIGAISDPFRSWLFHFIGHPRTLRDLSAMTIRSVLGERLFEAVNSLPVPPAIRSYLRFCHLDGLKPLFGTGEESLELTLYAWSVPST